MTDRFLIELRPVAAGQVPKDADFKYENLVQGLKHVPIKVWRLVYSLWILLIARSCVGLATRSLRGRGGFYGLAIQII